MNSTKLNILKMKLKNIKDNDLCIKVFQLLTMDSSFSYSKNNYGIFFNISILSDDILAKVWELLDDKQDIKNEKLKYNDNKYFTENYSNTDFDFKIKKQLTKAKRYYT